MDRVPGEAVCMKPELAVVARRQDGVVTRQQAIAAGYSVDQIDRLLTRGALTVIRPGLYRSPSAPVTWRSQAWAVLLAAGPLAVLSHGVAAECTNWMECRRTTPSRSPCPPGVARDR